MLYVFVVILLWLILITAHYVWYSRVHQIYQRILAEYYDITVRPRILKIVELRGKRTTQKLRDDIYKTLTGCTSEFYNSLYLPLRLYLLSIYGKYHLTTSIFHYFYHETVKTLNEYNPTELL